MSLSLHLRRLPGDLLAARLPADAPLPAGVDAGGFLSVTRTPDELSVIAVDRPEVRALLAGAQIEPGWICLQVAGPFAFTVTGVMAALSAALAEADVPLLALSTWDTDYLLVKRERLGDAVAALRGAGHVVEGPEGLG